MASAFLESKFGAIIAYSLCSSTMLLVNKTAMVDLKFPGYVSLVQFIFAVIVVYGLKFSKLIRVDDLEWSKVRPFFWYVLSFTGSIYCNMKALGASNVETVIVFRSMSPVIVSVLDYLFLGRELPTMKSTMAMLIIVAGSTVYVLSDSAFAMNGISAYTWVFGYLVLICFNMSYGKFLISDVKMQDPVWGSVLYNNVLSLVPTFLIATGAGESATDFFAFNWKFYHIQVVFLSCVIGTAISWTGKIKFCYASPHSLRGRSCTLLFGNI